MRLPTIDSPMLLEDDLVIVASGGSISLVEVIEFACYSAACRPPTSGGTGGSKPGGTSTHKLSSADDLTLLFPSRRGSASNKVLHDDGTLSVEGLDVSGNPTKFSEDVETATAKAWDSIGNPKEAYIRNLEAAGKLAMGIDLITGDVDRKAASEATAASKWYTTANGDCRRISAETGLEFDKVVAAATVLSAGRLWSGTKNGNIETAEALAKLVKNPIDIDISQADIDMMNWRRNKAEKDVGRIGLDTDGISPGKVSSKDLDAATLVEILYAKNTLRGHESFEQWTEKTKAGKKSSPLTKKVDPLYPFFTSKGTVQVKQAVAVLRGEVTARQSISGPKYSSFFSNIANPDKDYSSTNDTWHYRIMAGNLPITHTKESGSRTDTMVRLSIKEFSPDGEAYATTQDVFQKGPASTPEGLKAGDSMFRDTTVITRAALDNLKASYPNEFGSMKMHEFQALIWVHYGGGVVKKADRNKKWFSALDKMSEAGL